MPDCWHPLCEYQPNTFPVRDAKRPDVKLDVREEKQLLLCESTLQPHILEGSKQRSGAGPVVLPSQTEERERTRTHQQRMKADACTPKLRPKPEERKESHVGPTASRIVAAHSANVQNHRTAVAARRCAAQAKKRWEAEAQVDLTCWRAAILRLQKAAYPQRVIKEFCRKENSAERRT